MVRVDEWANDPLPTATVVTNVPAGSFENPIVVNDDLDVNAGDQLEFEFELDPQLEEDMNAIMGMVRQIREHGLAVEVIYEFGKNMKAGYSVVESVNHALYEWDM